MPRHQLPKNLSAQGGLKGRWGKKLRYCSVPDRAAVIEAGNFASCTIVSSPTQPRESLESAFLETVVNLLVDLSGYDLVQVRLVERERLFLCEAVRGVEPRVRLEILPCPRNDEGQLLPCLQTDDELERLCREMFLNTGDASVRKAARNGSLWTNSLTFGPEGRAEVDQIKSVALIPLFLGNAILGLLQLGSRRRGAFAQGEVEFYEIVAQTLGVALAHRRTQIALRERIKELSCLIGVAQVAARPSISLEGILQSIVELLPPAWFYPEIASARVTLDRQSCVSERFRESAWRQMAQIVVGGETRGLVEVFYADERLELDEGPFLQEERNLIEAVAKEIALIIERRQTEEEKRRIEEQLRHADRLATIGQVAAGVAHELNEPLGSILGFAQLAHKTPGLPPGVAHDIGKIEKASLHAREVVRNLLLFARQQPPQKNPANLNRIIEDAIYLVSARCAKSGIELEQFLAPDVPEIVADAAQLQQVLMNLVVNAIQAMPQGGRLTIRTLAALDHVSLIVQDTGIGMSPEVRRQMFVPFFTTKQVHEGTGLGLSVVHGIVTSHGGKITVQSEVGRGSRFEILLPIDGREKKETPR